MKAKYFLLIILIIYSRSINALSWIDLPNVDLVEAARNNFIILQEVDHQIKEYHSINKLELGKVHLRIKKLESIVEYININTESAYQLDIKNNHHALELLTNLQTIASNKIEYLRAILEFYQRYSDEPISWAEEFVSKDQILISMHNELLYTLNNKILGKFWLEYLDPCHRALVNYYEQWNRLDNPKPLFYLWLEEQYVPESILQVKYPSQDDIAKYYDIKSVNNKLYWNSPDNGWMLLDSSSREFKDYLFIIDKNKNIKIAPNKCDFRHSSLSNGKPVYGIGNIESNNGKITLLFLNSGHYLPGWDNYEQTLYWFLDNNLVDKDTLTIKFYDGPNINQLNLDDFIILLQSKHEV
jgi:hypothetical protein